MAGDYSRDSFDIRRRFAAVLMQQGRVQLDADWNEEAAILDERIRRQALDTFGRVAASRFSTPDAFRIGTLAGPPRDLSIEPGRYYIDGLVAEALPSDGAPLRYLAQPFLPNPPALPVRGGAIVYLDLWQREVTSVEEPALLDVALGGVDTAARLQTVWQVRLLARADAACGADLDALFPASPARLSTDAVAPPAPEDPCLIAPKVGYRGLENRFYRVEVHVGGAAGAARFKFSRDNASVRSPVIGIASELRSAVGVTVLTVARIGRDPGLRIGTGDWIEVTDEGRFLNGLQGFMAQVAEPPEERPGEDGVRVVLDRAIPFASEPAAEITPARLLARRMRVIRWDQSAPRSTLDADGLITIGAAPVELENGVQVTFSLAAGGGTYRAGDWWSFAARTADASVERLAAAPPDGPRHRYAQLAAFGELGRGDSPSDCRSLWPPLQPGGGDGCCTVVVRPGEDVQAAIDSLPPEGGCVCLKPGVHALRDALRIRRPRVSLHAEAPFAATLRRAGLLPIVSVEATPQGLPTTDVAIEGVAFQLGSLADTGAVDALLAIGPGTSRVSVTRCRFGVQDFAGRAAAVGTRGMDVSITECLVERLPIGVHASAEADGAEVLDNAFLASGEGAAGRALTRSAAASPGEDQGLVAVWIEAANGTIRVNRNLAVGYRHGVVLGTEPAGGKPVESALSEIVGNVVLRAGPPEETRPEPPPRATPAGVATQPATAEPVEPAGVLDRDAARLRARDVAGTLPLAGRARERALLIRGGLVASETDERASSPAAFDSADEIRARTEQEFKDSPAAIRVAATKLRTDAVRLMLDRAAAPRPPGASADAAAQDAAFRFAIVAAAGNCLIAENLVAWRTPLYGGILAGEGVRLVTGNDLLYTPPAPQADTPQAATNAAGATPLPALGIASGLGNGGAASATISNNVLVGPLHAVALGACAVTTTERNIVAGAVAGVLISGGSGNRVVGNLLFSVTHGVLLAQTAHAEVCGNLVVASRQEAVLALYAGTPVLTGRLLVSGNTLLGCGFDEELATAINIVAVDAAPGTAPHIDGTVVVVEHNLVVDTGAQAARRAGTAVGMSVAAPRVAVHGNEVSWGHPAESDAGRKLLSGEQRKPNRALVVLPLQAAGIGPSQHRSWAGELSITGNRFRGASADTLVEVRDGPAAGDNRPPRFTSIVFTGNHVDHLRPLDQTQGGRATVELRGEDDTLITVSGNVVRGTGRAPSVLVQGPKQVAFAGNATSGPLIGSAGAVNVLI